MKIALLLSTNESTKPFPFPCFIPPGPLAKPNDAFQVCSAKSRAAEPLASCLHTPSLMAQCRTSCRSTPASRATSDCVASPSAPCGLRDMRCCGRKTKCDRFIAARRRWGIGSQRKRAQGVGTQHQLNPGSTRCALPREKNFSEHPPHVRNGPDSGLKVAGDITAASCQQRTNAPQQKNGYSITSVARASRFGGRSSRRKRCGPTRNVRTTTSVTLKRLLTRCSGSQDVPYVSSITLPCSKRCMCDMDSPSLPGRSLPRILGRLPDVLSHNT